jgi:TATA-box binding protein (TBP) (component of TFIID and TFIIIB)
MSEELSNEWDNFDIEYDTIYDATNNDSVCDATDIIVPESSDLYISTKTHIIYLCKLINNEYEQITLDLQNIFWKINIIPYDAESNGIIKKQIQITSLNKEELEKNIEKYDKNSFMREFIIKHIDNKDGRIKYKDVRKISVGISKKDIIRKTRKEKAAFYNCIVNIIRLKIDGVYKEFHVKIFNTGKIEVPGIHTEESRIKLMDKIIEVLQPLHNDKLVFKSKIETVLINSNFMCGYIINRDKLLTILENKYNIHSIFDSCSYPGIKCKFYYDNKTGIVNNKQQSYDEFDTQITRVSFMIFRTGSVIIVGNCNIEIIRNLYDFIKNMLKNEYLNIKTHIQVMPEKKKKIIRKKIIKIQTI